VSDIQDMLFGAVSTPVVGDELASHRLQLCALNLQGPAPARATPLVDWLIATQSNVLVLTEIHSSEGGRQVIAGLRASGYTVTNPSGWQHAKHFTAVASKGFTAVASKGFTATTAEPAIDPRINAVDLTSTAGTLRVIGIYGPTNGMTADSSAIRSAFQSSCLAYLGSIRHPNMIIAGDLNVIEPNHQPTLPDFAQHDYDFYTGLLSLGLADAYRQAQPAGVDHSWSHPRYGAQRLDHTLISAQVGTLVDSAYDHSTRSQRLSDHSALTTTVELSTTSNPTEVAQ
jgi:exodeoxyribonuclease-3